MVSINYASKDICCKIVFYGPGLSGKTTNLQYVHRKIPPQTRGELISLATDQDRTLYFDFLPVDIGKIHGFSIKFQLYTVPGQVYYNATRKLVLRGVDGLVFVADSQRSKMDENIESFQNLVENLGEYGYDIEKLPLVFQYNKRDLSDISSVDELERVLNPKGLSQFEAVATQGVGVFDTLKCISKLVLEVAKGKKVVPESEAPVKEEMMVESKSAQPERVTDLQDLKTPISVSLSAEKQKSLEKRTGEMIPGEIFTSVSEKWSDAAHPHGCPPTEDSPSPSEHTGDRPDEQGDLPAQHDTDHESIPQEKKGEFETHKEEMVSGELPFSQQREKVESGASLSITEGSPTIISWSATKQKKRHGAKGFFLWRFFRKLLNR
jgi:signal recognition particle receptor subunit beta